MYKPGGYQEPLDTFRNLSDACIDQLTNIYWTLSKWPSLCGVRGDINVSKPRHDVYPRGASSLVGETEEKQGRKYVHEDGERVYKSQRLTGHKGLAPGEIYIVVIELAILPLSRWPLSLRFMKGQWPCFLISATCVLGGLVLYNSCSTCHLTGYRF